MIQSDGTDEKDLNLLQALIERRFRGTQVEAATPPRDACRISPSTRWSAAGREVQVDVRLGRGATVRVRDAWWDDADVSGVVAAAERIGSTIIDLQGRSAGLRSMLSKVGAAARRNVAAENRRGAVYALSSVELAPVDAGAVDDPVVVVAHTALDVSLRPRAVALEASSVTDVDAFFAEARATQLARSSDRRALEAAGATGRIDPVVVAAIGAAGLDPSEVVRRLHANDDWFLHVDGSAGRNLTLEWEDGIVWSSVAIADGVTWFKGTLSFEAAPRTIESVREGDVLSQVYAHPLFGCETKVWSVDGSWKRPATIVCEAPLIYFNGFEGRLWAA